jgi:hypothetical protein
MEVLQLQVIHAGNGFFIAAYDENAKRFCRLSKEVYKRSKDARDALFTGNWTIA